MQMLIDSQWVDASSHEWMDVHNPATGDLLDRIPNATLDDALRAVEAAQAGKTRMARLPSHERAAILHRVADRIDENLAHLSEQLARENGKPIIQTRAEVVVAARIFRGCAEEGKRMFGRVTPMDAVPGLERHIAMTIRQPVGVVATIIPFNYPVELYAHKAAAALAAGNAVIAKPPPECPLTLLEIAGYLEDAGLPRAAHQVITGTGVQVGEFLVSHPDVNLITVTGSTNTGRRISELAAKYLKPVHLELGGNDVMIVCEDADLDTAAEAIVLGRLARGNGQICCAVKRVLVKDSAHDELADVLTAKARKLKMGNPLDEDTDVGPLISRRAAERVEAAVHQAVEQGAVVRAGGHRRDAFYEPTVLTHVTPSIPVFAEEVFGPVAPLVPFTTMEEALTLANDSPYGLQAAVFTNDITRAFDTAYKLQVGGVIINWSTALRAETLPFGGVKLSGHGREGLHDTLEAMTYTKSIVVYNALSVYDPAND
jgi:lactaldehyde dehydrogenase